MRVSLFGGGTDFPSWFEKNGGVTLSFCINKYVYVSIRRPYLTSPRYKFVYSKSESENSLQSIQHPVIREALKYSHFTDPIECHYDADLPGGTGLGASSAFAISLFRGIDELNGEHPSARSLARRAIELERYILREPGGLQDQIAIARGGISVIKYQACFEDGFMMCNGNISTDTINNLISNTVIFFTGVIRLGFEIESMKLAEIATKERYYRNLMRVAETAILKLSDNPNNCDFVGELLDESWASKKALTQNVSNHNLDAIYDRARRAGAIGGKLLGAGGGGFMLFYCEQDRKESVINSLPELVEIPFEIEKCGPTVIKI